MEPLNDDELNKFLSEWRAPSAPLRLDARVLGRLTWWRWLMTGTIRVPVPAGIAAMLVLALSVYWAVTARRAVNTPVQQTVTLSDFQPVKQLQPRIIRSGYEGQ
jgi:hypothetical protein